jgi:hypothetical protein
VVVLNQKRSLVTIKKSLQTQRVDSVGEQPELRPSAAVGRTSSDVVNWAKAHRAEPSSFPDRTTRAPDQESPDWMATNATTENVKNRRMGFLRFGKIRLKTRVHFIFRSLIPNRQSTFSRRPPAFSLKYNHRDQ